MDVEDILVRESLVVRDNNHSTTVVILQCWVIRKEAVCIPKAQEWSTSQQTMGTIFDCQENHDLRVPNLAIVIHYWPQDAQIK